MPGTGREAQHRRTRRAILDATAVLLRDGAVPSVNEVAAAADVARRTVYLHFPTMDQLVLDAVVGVTSAGVDEALAAAPADDARARVRALIDAIGDGMAESLPLGRQLIRLTVDTPASTVDDGPRRGYRRIGWIESALEPVRGLLDDGAWQRLVSSLAMVIGWEAFIVLIDVRGLDGSAARDVCVDAALTLVDAALSDST